MRRSYVTLDVFTDQLFGGNPLAVVLDAAGLSTEQMQKIAIEFGYSETTFVLPAVEADHTAHVRIFTPAGELPFAGHPNIGTAFALARQAKAQRRELPETLLFEEKAGLVPVRLERENGRVVRAELMAPEAMTRRSRMIPENAAACLGLEPADIRTDHHAPQVVSVGLPFLIVELASRDALRRAHGELAAHRRLLASNGISSVYAYTRNAGESAFEKGSDIQGRMFSPLDGIAEDPATGSATVAAVAFLSALENGADLSLTFTQGVDMGRPSLLDARTEAGKAYVAGSCVPVMDGFFTLESEV